MPAHCPGPCNTAWRRAETALAEAGTEHGITPAWGQPTQCYGCVDRTYDQLGQLPRLIADIHEEAREGTPTRLTGTIGSTSTPSWPGQASRLLVDTILGGLLGLAEDILTLRGLPPAPRIGRRPQNSPDDRETRLVASTVAVLRAHWEWAMQHHPAADETYARGQANPGSQVSEWFRTAQRFVKADEQRETRRLAPCPRCAGPYLVESRDLRLVDGRPYIECRDPDCRRIMTGAEYDAYVRGLCGGLSAA